METKKDKDETRIEVASLTPRSRSLDENKPSTGSQSLEDESEKKKEAQPGFGNFLRVLKFGDGLDYFLMTSSFIAAVGAGIAMPLMFLVFGRLVGDLTSYFTPGTSVTKDQFMHQIESNTLYLVYLGGARFVMSYIAMLTVRISGVRISSRLRIAYLSAIFRQSVATVDKISPGAIASRLTTNSNVIESGISQQFCLAIQASAFTIGLYVVAFIKSALLTLVATASVPVVVVAYGFAVPFMNKIWYESEAYKESASSLAFEIFQSIRIVVAFGAGERMTAKHSRIVEQARMNDRRLAPIMGALLAPMFLAIYAIFGLTFWFGVQQYSKGNIKNVGTIIVVLFSVLWAVMSIYHLYNPIMQMTRAASAATEMFAVIDAPLPDESGYKDDFVNVKVDDIIFKDVSFAYPARPDTVILNNLTVRFQTGKTTAIVGPSGSGKSTIVGLLEKWYNPNLTVSSPPDSPQDEFIIEKFVKATTIDSSGIFVGGINLNEIDAKWWRSNIGLVQQEPFLFNDTIYKNVANGLAGTKWEKESEAAKFLMVRSACQEAFVDDFVSKLPLLYDTIVGEGGMKMSGGQRQRIAIARAIVKNPTILILDEATSAIDVRTERVVQQALDRVSQARTTIVIAHRLSTIKKADKIVVMRHGQVVEQGTHNELLRYENGVYFGLVRAQEVEAGAEEEQIDDDTPLEDPATQLTASRSSISALAINKDDTAPYRARGFFGSLGKLVFEHKSKWPLYCMILLGSCIGASAYPVQAYLFAQVIDTFTILVRSELLQKGTFWALMFVVLAFAVGFGFLIIGWCAALVASDVAGFYRQEYLGNLLKKKIHFFDKECNSAGTLTSRISTDATQLMQLLGGEMALQLVGFLGLVGSVIISFYYGWKLTLVGMFSIMPLIMGAGYYRVRLEKDFERMNASVFAETAQFGAEAITGFRTVKALMMEDSIMDRFDTLLKNHIKKAIKNTRISTLVFSFSESAEMFCQALFFWYGGKLLADREYDIIHFFVIYMGVMQSSTSLGMWFSLSPNVAEATAAANRILSSRPPTTFNAKPPLSTSDRPAKIEFRNVHFSYPERPVPVLSGIDLSIEPGQFAAFVGASGSGKSTLIALLERFYTPTQGQILFDGVDISTVSEDSYRENLGLVAQESTLFDGSVRENVSMSLPPGAPNARILEIQNACAAAQIHSFITSLPQGYDTPLGNRGTALSGGQRQRLALARALLRQPTLLLLDEATSNLDSESERLVQDAIERAAMGEGDGQRRRTVIAVAHRLATIQHADVIFVVGSGRVLERGSHHELLARRGVYWQMCQAQALDR